MRFGFVNEQPNFHIRIHVQSLSAPLSEFSPISYPCLLSLGLINRFDPDVLTFCTAINFMGNIYLYTQRLKFMILLRTSGKPEVLYSLCIHHYLIPMYVNLKPHLIHGDITATFTSLFAWNYLGVNIRNSSYGTFELFQLHLVEKVLQPCWTYSVCESQSKRDAKWKSSKCIKTNLNREEVCMRIQFSG